MSHKNACKNLGSLLATFLLVFSLSVDFYAAPGDLDPTFGNHGVVTTTMSVRDNSAGITDIEVQPDGKFLIAGVVEDYCECGNNVPSLVAFIARYHPKGSLDHSFGKGGKIIFTPESGEFISEIALQPDGKIVGVGYKLPFEFAVFRYNANGTLDASFGTGGKVVTDFSGWLRKRTTGVVIQSDSKIVVIGQLYIGSPVNSAIAVVRYNADGSLDAAFGTDGKAITTVRTLNNYPYDVALQPDGKIVVSGGGIDSDPDSNDNYLLLRYNSNGSLDNTFGVGGSVITDIASGAYSATGGVALQPDGKILVNGSSGIVRYNTNGSIDTGFAVNGIFRMGSWDIALQPDGKIVTAGGYGGFSLTRLNADGSPDTSFGTNGNVITPIGVGGSVLALQPDGKILSGGQLTRYRHAEVVIVRYSGQ